MIREILHPRRNKLAIAASLAVVGLLTALTIVTNSTRERQDHVEHTFSIERVQVTRALCGGDRHSSACRSHALNLLKACLEYKPCAGLLHRAAEDKVGPAPEGAKGAKLAGGTSGENHNSSRGDSGEPSGGNEAPAPAEHPEPATPHHQPTHHGGGGGLSPTAQPQEPETTLPNGQPFPGNGKAEGVVQCVEAVDAHCAAEAAGTAAEAVGHALSGDTQEE